MGCMIGMANALAAEPPILFQDSAFDSAVADVAVNSTGPTFVDYDNDGDLDIYVPTEAHLDGHDNRLFENDGHAKFTNVAVARGVDNRGGLARGASWGDIDNDGDMDLAVANMPPSAPGAVQVPMTVYKNLLIETGKPDFTNITRGAGFLRNDNEEDAKIGGVTDTGAGVAWADYNNDGFVDLYWKGPDYDVDNVLFRNNGDGSFSDVTEAASAGILGRVKKGKFAGFAKLDRCRSGWKYRFAGHERG